MGILKRHGQTRPATHAYAIAIMSGIITASKMAK